MANDKEGDEALSAEEDRINEKDTEASYRTVAYRALVSKIHNKIQIAFAVCNNLNYTKPWGEFFSPA